MSSTSLPSPISQLKIGEIIKVWIPDLEKSKYFLVLHHGTKFGRAKVFYINSESPFADDLVLLNKDFPCLPPSRTGESIVSCKSISFLSHDVLRQHGWQHMGFIEKATAAALLHHITHKVTALDAKERAFAIAVVSMM